MRSLACYAFSIGAAALISGCAESHFSLSPELNTDVSSRGLRSPNHSRIFKYTNNEQSFRVPKSIKELSVTVTAASGGKDGGKGGEIKATIPVTPGERLYIYVGGKGGRSPGYNGGGTGGGFSAAGHGWGGAGASDIREYGSALSDRIIVAGGGGGGAGISGSCNCDGSGGSGGGNVGAPGTNGNGNSGGGGGGGGQGGSQYSGGQFGEGAEAYSCGGNFGLSGDYGVGGSGGSGGCGGTSGGGGGGGYYGGGGGGGGVYTGSSGAGGGGGGGSSYFESSATHVKSVRGKSSGNGQIVISWSGA